MIEERKSRDEFRDIFEVYGEY